jgi:hypothetical protein
MSDTTTTGNSSSNGNAANLPPPIEPSLNQTAESDWMRALQQHPDPLVRKLEMITTPLMGIYQQMSQVILRHLKERPQIEDLQDVHRQTDEVLQYSRQLGRLVKLEMDLRTPAGKFDPMLHFDAPQPSEKPRV